MRIASIDIGSNTILLLIAEIKENEIIPIRHEHATPRLSKGIDTNKAISQKSIQELLSVLNTYKGIIIQEKVKKVIIAGTAALRKASNQKEIVNIVKDETGYLIEVISGETEAYLSYLGANYPMKGAEPKGVLDIGGGSTELVIGNESQVLFLHSFPCGVVSLREKFISDYPPDSQVINSMNKEINNIFTKPELNTWNISELIAIGGTPTAIYFIYNKLEKFLPEEIEGKFISLDAVNSVINIFSTNSIEEIRRKYSPIIEGREDILLAGCLILKNIMSKLNQHKVRVTTKGLRYGLIADYLIKTSDKYSE